MLYNCQISEVCEKRLVRQNYYDIKTIMEGIDYITNFPQCGKMIQPKNDYRCYRIKSIRIYYFIDKNIIKIISFSKGRDYSELIT